MSGYDKNSIDSDAEREAEALLRQRLLGNLKGPRQSGRRTLAMLSEEAAHRRYLVPAVSPLLERRGHV